MDFGKLASQALNPWVILASLAAGAATGMALPEASMNLALVGDVYVDLLKMITLPFMVSAVIFSLQRLIRDGGAGSLLGRVAVVLGAFAVLSAVFGALAVLAIQPGANLSEETRQAFGKMVGANFDAGDVEMSLHGVDAADAKAPGLAQVVLGMVPANIFQALAQGEALKALVFSMLFGLAVGTVPGKISDGLTFSLVTVYQSCQVLMRWFSFPVPLVLFCMAATQLAKTGLGPLSAMIQFVLALTLGGTVLLAGAVWVTWQRSGKPLGTTLDALKGSFALALATRNSATCMPAMIECLVDRLGFARSRVELLVPLCISLLRTGPMLYYATATIFIAQMYGRPLGPDELAIVVVASVLAGFASAGMTGLVTVSLVGMVCGYLALPFEAAFILLLAVDPISDMVRTLVLVIGNTAAVSLMCPRPAGDASAA
ncbi:MAG TPA: cation:dicarboxylase symporter family transporter [Rhodocyclaceae bacterium]